MSATLTADAIAADVSDTVALPDDIRAFRGILIGGALSCVLWAGIIAAVMAVI